MRDDRCGQHVHVLAARIVAHQQARELAVLDDGRGETPLAVLERQAKLVEQKSGAFELVVSDFDGGDWAGGRDQRVVAFELQDVDAVAHHGVESQVQRLQAVEEVVGGRLEQCEVGLVVDGEHFRVGFLAALGALQFDVAVVGDELRGHEHAVAGDHRPEAVVLARILLRPRTEEIVVLIRGVDSDHGEFRGGGNRARVVGSQEGGLRREAANQQGKAQGESSWHGGRSGREKDSFLTGGVVQLGRLIAFQRGLRCEFAGLVWQEPPG